MLEWDNLRFVLAIKRGGSMQAAAQALGVDRATVVRRLDALESQLNVRLFDRRSDGCVLTRAGLSIIATLEGVAEALTGLEKRVTGGDARPEGVVSVALPEFYAVKLLAPALNRFHAAYPGITLEVRTGHDFLNLARGEADIACRNRRPEHNTLVARRVGYGAMALYASRGYLEKHGSPKDGDFAGHSLLLFDETLAGFPGSEWVEARLKGAHVVMRTNEMMPLLTGAKEGAGLAFLPALATRGEPDLSPVWPGILSMTDCFLVTRRDLRQQARVRAVFDFIVRLCTECAGDLSGAAVAEIFGDRGGFGSVNVKRRKPEVPSSDRPES